MPVNKLLYRACANFAGRRLCGEVGQDGKPKLFFVQNWTALSNGKLEEVASCSNNNSLLDKTFTNSTGYFVTSDESMKVTWESQAAKVLSDITEVGGDAGVIIKQLVSQGKVTIIRMGNNYHTVLNSNITEEEGLNLEGIYKKVETGYQQHGKYLLDDLDDFSFLYNFFNRNNIINPPDSIRTAIVNFYDDMKAKKGTLDSEQFDEFMDNYNQHMRNNFILGPKARFTEPQGDTSPSKLGDGSHYNSSEQVGHTVDVPFPSHFDGLIFPASRGATGRDGIFFGSIDSLKSNTSSVNYEQKMMLEPINNYVVGIGGNGKRTFIPWAITRSNDTDNENINIEFGGTRSRCLTQPYAQCQSFSDVWGKAVSSRVQMAKANVENSSDAKVIIIDVSKSDTISRGFNNTADAISRAQKLGEISTNVKRAINSMAVRNIETVSTNEQGWVKAKFTDDPALIFVKTNPLVDVSLKNENFESSGLSSNLGNIPVDSDK